MFRPAPRPAHALLVAALATATAVQWIGASAVLPLLPIYLLERNTSATLIGAVMGSFFVTGVVAQVLAGRIGDRIGHRRVLIAALLGFALASAGFLLEVSGWGFLVLRGAQGAAAGAAQVASLALVARAVPADARGRAYAAVSGAELAGIAIGPMLGSAVGMTHMGTLFLIASAAATLACLPVLAARRVAGASTAPLHAGRPDPLPREGISGRAFRGALLVGVIGGLLTGVYEACWSLLMHDRGATDAQVGLSWTLFALPYVLAAPLAGYLADRRDRRVLVMVGLVSAVGWAAVYPFLPGVGWLIGLGMVESFGYVFAVPAAQSMLTEHVAAGAVGRAQGLFVGLQTAGIAVGAGISGAAYGVDAALPFVAATVLLGVLCLGVPVLWRGVPGRVAS